jgi:hypothetical protein
MSEKRQHVRTAFPAELKLMHPSFGALSVKSRDMSNGGVFVFTGGEVDLPVGTEVSVQAEDMEGAPVVQATVVRVEAEGVALMFSAAD